LAGAVLADDADRFAGLDGEIHVTQYPVLFAGLHRNPEPACEAMPFASIHAKGLAYVVDAQHAHNTSTISSAARRKTKRATSNRPSANPAIWTTLARSGACP